MSRPLFFTGITPTGTLTIGHYCGLIRHILAIQEQYEIIIMIADLHALTVFKTNLDYQQKSKEMASLLYACGLKEENCKIFIQSQIVEHVELAYLLSAHISVAKLENMIQYKEKKKKQTTGNLSLLSYPVLMTADIIMYDADLVIVGKDQKQHLELTTYLIKKINNFFQTNLFKIPKFIIPDLGSKILGLKDPFQKMSKSKNDFISLLDSEKDINEKVMRAKTDSENKIYYDEVKKAGISNLLTIYVLFSNTSLENAQKKLMNINYSQFKKEIVELLCKELTSIQSKYHYYLNSIDNLLKKNNEYLKELAKKKISTIKKAFCLTSN